MRTGSYLNAFFKGRQEAEYPIFAALSSLPLITMDAERAARQVVRAAQRGDAVRTLSVPATLLARFHGMFPGPTTDILGLVNRLLPTADGPTEAERGLEVSQRIDSDALRWLTTLGRASAERLNELPGTDLAGREATAPPEAPLS
jgi:hypothetical protein